MPLAECGRTAVGEKGPQKAKAVIRETRRVKHPTAHSPSGLQRASFGGKGTKKRPRIASIFNEGSHGGRQRCPSCCLAPEWHHFVLALGQLRISWNTCCNSFAEGSREKLEAGRSLQGSLHVPAAARGRLPPSSTFFGSLRYGCCRPFACASSEVESEARLSLARAM